MKNRGARRRGGDDDGRTIADMNVAGMPWHRRDAQGERDSAPQEPLTRRQTARAVLSATLAGLVVALIFIAAISAFVFLLTCVWR